MRKSQPTLNTQLVKSHSEARKKSWDVEQTDFIQPIMQTRMDLLRFKSEIDGSQSALTEHNIWLVAYVDELLEVTKNAHKLYHGATFNETLLEGSRAIRAEDALISWLTQTQTKYDPHVALEKLKSSDEKALEKLPTFCLIGEQYEKLHTAVKRELHTLNTQPNGKQSLARKKSWDVEQTDFIQQFIQVKIDLLILKSRIIGDSSQSALTECNRRLVAYIDELVGIINQNCELLCNNETLFERDQAIQMAIDLISRLTQTQIKYNPHVALGKLRPNDEKALEKLPISYCLITAQWEELLDNTLAVYFCAERIRRALEEGDEEKDQLPAREEDEEMEQVSVGKVTEQISETNKATFNYYYRLTLFEGVPKDDDLKELTLMSLKSKL